MSKDYNKIKMPKQQVEFGISRFDCIPNEVVCEIMMRMSLEVRLRFLGAYPRFLELAQSSALETRVLTYFDRLTERQDLEKVLDPEGTRIQVKSLLMDRHWHCLNCKCNPMLDPDVFHLMPKLQVITFKDCELWPSKCACQEMKVCTFLDCQSWKMLLTKVRRLEFVNCHHGNEAKDMDILNSLSDVFNRVFLNSDSSILLREVSMTNFLPPFFIKKLMYDILTWTYHKMISGPNIPEIRMEIENHKRESIEIADMFFSSGEDFKRVKRLEICLKALYKTLKWPNDCTEVTSIKVARLEMTKNEGGILKIRLTEDFNMGLLRKELAKRLGKRDENSSME